MPLQCTLTDQYCSPGFLWLGHLHPGLIIQMGEVALLQWAPSSATTHILDRPASRSSPGNLGQEPRNLRTLQTRGHEASSLEPRTTILVMVRMQLSALTNFNLANSYTDSAHTCTIKARPLQQSSTWHLMPRAFPAWPSAPVIQLRGTTTK